MTKENTNLDITEINKLFIVDNNFNGNIVGVYECSKYTHYRCE